MRRIRIIACLTLSTLLLTAITSCAPIPQTDEDGAQIILPSPDKADAIPTLPSKPTQIPTNRPTITLAPTNTTVPSLTPAPKPEDTSTPFKLSNLDPNKRPYFVYYKESNNTPSLYLINADGSGVKTIVFPENSYLGSLKLSPSGEWLAFYNHKPVGYNESLPQDLSLFIMHLPDGQVTKVTKLLPNNYPYNLENVVKQARINALDLRGLTEEQVLEMVKPFFTESIYKLSWASNDRYFAFSGAMDGPSTDVYVYEIDSNKITRLTDGPGIIEWLDWFPDNKRILHSSAYSMCMGDCSQYHVVDLDKNSYTIKNFDSFGGSTASAGWSADSTMVLHTYANGVGHCCLRNFDFQTAQMSSIYSGSFGDFAINPKTGSMIISISPEDYMTDPLYEPGTYLIDASTGLKNILSTAYNLNYIGWKNYNFIGYSPNVIAFSESGKSVEVSPQNYDVLPSPDRNRVALFGGRYSTDGIEIVNEKLQRLFTFSNEHVSNVYWRPDSDGIFFVTQNALYYTDIPSETTPLKIDKQLTTDNSNTIYMEFGWVR